MKVCWKTKQGKHKVIFSIAAVLFLCLPGTPLVWSDDALNVKRDSEKTVYTVGASDERNSALDTQRDREKTVYSIGSNKTKKDEEERKEERAWDMLMNMNIVVDGRQDKHRNSKDPQSQTNQNQQAQPVPAK